MASYTVELRTVCEIYDRDIVEGWFKSYNLEDYLLPEQIEQINKYKIFSKDRLAKQIVDRFYMREIGQETPALFAHFAKVKMEEIMQEKLPLIYTMSLNYDPLINVDYTETFTRTAEGTAENTGISNSNSNSQSSGLNINNNTPQTKITKQDLDSGLYASNTSQSDTEGIINDTTNTNSNTKNNTLEEYTRNFKGNQGISATYQRMIQLFRENIVALNKDIFNELNSLFMGLY